MTNATNPAVQIVYPEDGWILQKLARLIIDGLPYVRASPGTPDTSRRWDITYYVNYAMFRPRPGLGRLLGATAKSRVSGAWFTHKESNVFEKGAHHLDFAICPCIQTVEMIRSLNRPAYLAYHGIDLERFTPKLRLGFVGRLYENHRKGEELFDLVQRLPFVQLVCTNGRIPEAEMPDFYQSIDYVLIASSAEGGPLCFQEGLASGKEIISTSVGMVRDFAGAPGVHIFDRENPATLVNLLTVLYEKRLALRQSIESYNEAYFVKRHDEVFREIVKVRKF